RSMRRCCATVATVPDLCTATRVTDRRETATPRVIDTVHPRWNGGPGIVGLCPKDGGLSLLKTTAARASVFHPDFQEHGPLRPARELFEGSALASLQDSGMLEQPPHRLFLFAGEFQAPSGQRQGPRPGQTG